MTDELCDKCGIGFFLPSGRCDHCNCLQCLAHVRELLTPEEKATHAKWEREAKSAEFQRVTKELESTIKARDSKALEGAVKAIHGGTEKVSPEYMERTFNARRRGAIQALKRISDWALDCMEGEDLEAFRAYENCHVTCMNLVTQYETKAGAEMYFGLNWKETLWQAYQAGCGEIDSLSDEYIAKERFEEWFKNLGRPTNC